MSGRTGLRHGRGGGEETGHRCADITSNARDAERKGSDMASFAQTIAVGNLGRDPEVRYLPSGDAVCNFSVAVTEKNKSRDGEAKETTTWYRVNTFGKLAEICGQYLTKGSAVMVVGKMQSRKWEKDGVERESWELRADSMQMLGGKGEGGKQGGNQQDEGGNRPAPARAAGSDLDDDIPFDRLRGVMAMIA